MKNQKNAGMQSNDKNNKTFAKRAKEPLDQRSKPVVTEALMEERMMVGPRNITLSGAEHFVMDIDTHVAKPSAYGVDEMRDWSIVNEK